MKKQILILTFFVAAILAGTTTAFGQLSPGVTADGVTQPIDPLSCAATSLPLHPMPGVPYTYQMDGDDNPNNPVQSWTWWATKDSTFIDGTGTREDLRLLVTSGQLLDASGNYGVAGDADTVSITWSSTILANTDYEGDAGDATFVVAYGEGLCSDNIEVYEINPVPAFVIDIANVDASGTTLDWEVADSICVSPIASAWYRSTDDSLIMDYGVDTIYFEVAAANFVTSFTPILTLEEGLTGSQTADIGIASSLLNAQGGVFLGSGQVTDFGVSDSTSFGGVELTAADPDDITNGVSFWVRVVVHNNSYESLTRQPLTLSVDGIDASDQWDMDDGDCGDPTAATYDRDDQATETVTPRPTIEGTPDLGTTTIDTDTPAVDPEDVIDKQRN